MNPRVCITGKNDIKTTEYRGAIEMDLAVWKFIILLMADQGLINVDQFLKLSELEATLNEAQTERIADVLETWVKDQPEKHIIFKAEFGGKGDNNLDTVYCKREDIVLFSTFLFHSKGLEDIKQLKGDK